MTTSVVAHARVWLKGAGATEFNGVYVYDGFDQEQFKPRFKQVRLERALPSLIPHCWC